MRPSRALRTPAMLVAVAGLVLSACSGTSPGATTAASPESGGSTAAASAPAAQSPTGEQPEIIVSIWDQGAPFQAPVIATHPDLTAKVPAKISWVPINAAPPTIAGMKSGAFNIVSLVGNPPVVAAISNGTEMKVVKVESFDNQELVVHPDIKTVADLAGKTCSDLVGSSDDYAFRGWLKSLGLEDKVEIVEVSGQQTIASAFKTGAIDCAWVDAPQALLMKADGGVVLATSADALEAGYSGVNVMLVRNEDIANMPEVIQGFVCADMGATDLLLGDTADDAMRAATQVTGQAPEDSVKAGHAQPPVPNSDALAQLAGTTGDLKDSPLVFNYVETSKFLVDLGRIEAPITAEQVVNVIDPQFVQAAQDGACD